MKCPKCGHALANNEGALYCAYCGARLDGSGKKRSIRRALAAGIVTALLFSLALAAAIAAAMQIYGISKEKEVQRAATALSLSVNGHKGYFYPEDTIKIGMELYPPQASPETVEWSSSDESIATVDGTGNVSFHKDGEAVITAKLDNGVEGSLAFSVVKRPYRISLNEKKVKLEVGDTFSFEPVVIPGDAVYDGISWESSDRSILSVDDDGVIKGMKQGRASVTATVAGNVVATADVFVYKYKFDLLTEYIFENGSFDKEYDEYYVTLSFSESRENGELMNKHIYLSYFPDSDQIVLYSDIYNDEGSLYYEVLVYFDRNNDKSALVQFYFASDKYDGSILDTVPTSIGSPGLEINAWGRIDLASYTTSSEMDFERYDGDDSFRGVSLQITNSFLKNSMSLLKEHWESFDVGGSMGEVLGLYALQES